MLTKSDEKVIRQILDSSLKGFVTKQDIKDFATKQDLRGFVTKEDIDEVKRDLKIVKKDTGKIRRDLEMVTGEFDKDIIGVKKRVDNLEKSSSFATLQ